MNSVMKKTILCLLFLSISIYAQQEQTVDSSDDPDILTAQVIRLFSEGKNKEALPLALQLIEAQQKQVGKDHPEIAGTLRVVGYIYSRLNEPEKAVDYFSRAFEIFQKHPNSFQGEQNIYIGEMLVDMSISKYRANDVETAVRYSETAIDYFRKTDDIPLLKIAHVYNSLGNMRYNGSEYAAAAGYYEKSLDLRYRQLGAEDFVTLDAFDRCLCAYKKDDADDEIKRLKDRFYPDLQLTKYGFLKDPSEADDEDDKMSIRVFGPKGKDVVNGKAISLPAPHFPAVARAAQSRATVRVKIKIDEEGFVTFACAAFNRGLALFIEASEKAAYKARFQPTTKAGRPVPVTGIIVYRFTR